MAINVFVHILLTLKYQIAQLHQVISTMNIITNNTYLAFYKLREQIHNLCNTSELKIQIVQIRTKYM